MVIMGSWMDPIINGLQKKSIPKDENATKKLKFKAFEYYLIGDELYRRAIQLYILNV